MDITGHFESASCVIEVDGSDTLAQVKGKLLAELGVPRARHVGVRMKGGGDIGNDDLRICDTEMDEGCAVELYCTGANISPGVIPRSEDIFSLTLSPCDRYLAVQLDDSVDIFDTETRECLCSFPCYFACIPAFSPCSEWISSANGPGAEVHDVKTGALKHSFRDEGEKRASAWSPCGTKLLSCCLSRGLQVWDIATGVVVHEWGDIVEDYCGTMVVSGNRVAMLVDGKVTVRDYTTGVEVFVFTCSSFVNCIALSPNQRFITACCRNCVRVWNMETGERVFEDVSDNDWGYGAVSNDIVAAYSAQIVCLWSISTGKQLWHRDVEGCNGLAISSCGGVVMYAGWDDVKIVDISHLS